MTETPRRSRHCASSLECFLCSRRVQGFRDRLHPTWRIRRVDPKLRRPGRLPVDGACPGEHHIAARAGMCISDAYGELMIGLGLVAGVLTRTASGFGIMLLALLGVSSVVVGIFALVKFIFHH